MGYTTNLVLGASFVVVGLCATVLQLWLWTFPMVPDPHGVDPNGVTTAPRPWRIIHRLLGYLFIGLYLVLLSQMVPRLWNYDEDAWNGMSIAHALIGAAIGPVLLFKIIVLRRIQKIGKSLRPLGLTVFALSLLAVAIVAPPAFALQAPDNNQARNAVLTNCTQCHGLSKVVSEDGDREDWLDVLEDMAENAAERGMADPSAGRRQEIAQYLARALPED
jgi:hypothetical protein